MNPAADTPWQQARRQERTALPGLDGPCGTDQLFRDYTALAAGRKDASACDDRAERQTITQRAETHSTTADEQVRRRYAVRGQRGANETANAKGCSPQRPETTLDCIVSKVAPRSCRNTTRRGISQMFWWFERKGQHLRIEVLQLAPYKYELRTIQADGTEQVEMFTDADELAKRQRELQDALSNQGWTGPHGWVM